MDRVRGNQPVEKNIIKWRKIGGGSFRMVNGKIIKPNQIFEASIDDIPLGFREGCGKVIVPMDELPPTPAEQILETTTKYIIKPRGKGTSWFDVIEPESGKAMNERALRKTDAEILLAELS